MKKRPTISFIIHNLYDPYAQLLFTGVSEGANRHDVNLLCFSGRDLKSPREFDAQANCIYDLATPKNSDGVIISANVMTNFVQPDEVGLFYNRFRGLPAVSIAVPVPGISTVGIDNSTAMDDLIRHMAETHACRRIALITGPLHNPEVQARYASYRRVLDEQNLPFDPDLIVEGDFEIPSGREAIRILVDERRVAFDAVAAANDNMAAGALEALQERGIRVPEDVALAGFDDIRPSLSSTPPLTTVHQPVHEMGIKSVETMLDLLNGKSVPEWIRLPTHLTIRESCGCRPFAIRSGDPAGYQTKHAFTRQGLTAELRSDPEIRDLPIDPKTWTAGVASLFSDLRDSQSDRFIQFLHDRIKADILADRPLDPWQQWISRIRSHALHFEMETGVFRRLSGLLDQARCHIAGAEKRASHQTLLRHETHARTLREIGQSLTIRFHVQELMKDLHEALNCIGISTGFVALFESVGSDSVSDDPTSRVFLKLGVLEGQRLEFLDAEEPFSAETLIPLKLRPKTRATWIVLPLYFRTEHFGYAVFDHVPALPGLTYESLRDQISIALHGIRYHQNLVRAKEELEERARKLDESNQELEQFAYVASHDLQEPLRMISSYMSLLTKRYQNRLDGDAREFIGFAQEGALRMQTLIRDLLNYSRITTQAKPMEPVDTEHILKNVLDDLKLAIEESQARVSHSGLPEVMADPVQLERLFQNLIGNAIKYNKNLPEIRISAERGDGHWMFAFRDNGIGMDPRYVERIFGIFKRLHGRDEYSGTGIGLAVSKKIVERHGGKIWAESEGEGKGSTFYFTIPRQRDMYKGNNE